MSFPLRLISRQRAGWLLALFFFVNPFSKAGVEILFFLLLGVWLIRWVAPAFQRSSSTLWLLPESRKVSLPLAAYLALCALSAASSSFPLLSVQGLIRKTLEYLLFFIMASDIARQPGSCRRISMALLAAGWLIVAYSPLQWWAIHQVALPGIAQDLIRHRPLSYGRIVGPYENPNDLATFLMILILLVAGRILWRPFEPHRALWVLGILLLGSLALTQSRGGILGLWAGVLFLISLLPKGRGVRLAALLTLGLTGGLILISKGNLPDVLAFSDSGSQERSIMWNAACRMIRDRPVFGMGLNTFMANYLAYADSPNQGPAYAHNCFLQIAAETGISGLLAFLWFLTALFSLLWRRLRESSSSEEPSGSEISWLAGLTSGLVAFMVQSMVDTNLYALRQAALFWALGGAALGASLVRLKRPLAP
ncbi:MAG: O-antigen ligase family protein [Candidatus Omnitrophica bacterium]|nr:O-antigen ligase family protein [Candidatus Omnitrophota bacterium]